MLKGIDISNNNYHYLQTRDFYDILTADFVLMKASEGVTYKDPCLDKYYDIVHDGTDGRPDPDKLYGFYHYARPDNYNSPVAEAKHYLRYVSHHAGNCIYAVDIEGEALRMSKEYLDAWVYLWVKTVKEETGVTPLIYCSASVTERFELTYKTFGCGLWCASWDKRPTKKMIKPWDLFAIWQSGTTGGKLDVDIFNGSKSQFKRYCHAE